MWPVIWGCRRSFYLKPLTFTVGLPASTCTTYNGQLRTGPAFLRNLWNVKAQWCIYGCLCCGSCKWQRSHQSQAGTHTAMQDFSIIMSHVSPLECLELMALKITLAACNSLFESLLLTNAVEFALFTLATTKQFGVCRCTKLNISDIWVNGLRIAIPSGPV